MTDDHDDIRSLLDDGRTGLGAARSVAAAHP